MHTKAYYYEAKAEMAVKKIKKADTALEKDTSKVSKDAKKM
ncbi:MAG: hypothetical protein ACLRZ2_00585 [Veillonella sp.]